MKYQHTIIDVLQNRAINNANKILYRYIEDEESISKTLTFLEVNNRAKVIANRLSQTCKKGDRALMIYPAGLEFIVAFLGCLYAGVIAVPAYPPRKNQNIRRLKKIINDSDASIVMTDSKSFFYTTYF